MIIQKDDVLPVHPVNFCAGDILMACHVLYHPFAVDFEPIQDNSPPAMQGIGNNWV